MMKKITLLLFVSIMAITLSQAQVSLIKDINPTGHGIFQGQLDAAVINNQLVFSASDGTNISNVWISDGTLNGTNILHQNTPSGVSGNAQNFYYSASLGKVIFLGNNGAANTLSLFTTDGTTVGIESLSGTNYVFNPIQYPNYFTDFSGNVFFNLLEASQTIGYELYSTDGTEVGTGLVKELRPGFFGGIPSDLSELNGQLYFSSRDPVNGGRELWKSDGTTVGTNIFVDINIGNTDSNPESLIVFNNKLYFSADDGVNGRELWVTDGTVAGTQMVMDLYTGATGSNPENLTVLNNLLCFTASHPTLGTELFKMTTLETVFNVKNIVAGSGSSNPSNLHAFNGVLYFSADDGTNGIELWSSTGFSGTTNMLKNINTSLSSPDSNPGGFQDYNGKLYFSATDGSNGIELWVTDGTNAGTVMVEDINTSGNSSPTNLIVANDLLFFSANNGSSGWELFKYYDPTLSINDQELNSQITLFPNPSANHFGLESLEPITKVSIYDVQGKFVKSFKQINNSYNIEELTSGLYFINIKTDRGEITKKLIKE